MSADAVHRLWVMCGVPALWWPAVLLAAARRERRARRRVVAVLVRGGAAEEGTSGAAGAVTGRLGSGVREELPRRRDLRAPAAALAGRRSEVRGAVAWWAGVRGAVRRWLPVVGALCAGWVWIGGLGGVVMGLIAGVCVSVWRTRQERDRLAEEYEPAVAARQLPLAADLLAACIAAGASPVSAAQAVGEALKGPVGEQLARGAAEVRLGGEPADAWRRLAALPGAGALARLLERAGDSGVPAAGPVGRLATEARAERGRAATARARRAGVMVTAPVGLCFLPAFIAVGVLPVVIGLAGGLLGGGGG